MAIETNEPAAKEKSLNFLEEIVKEAADRGVAIQTRFPPEPNGYLHIGHAKSICINFGLAQKYGGKCNLRFDDTNPTKEDVEYVDSIKRDIRWLGFDWALERYASDYFDQLYEWAKELIRKGLAYVDDQTQEQIREGRGTVSEPGKESPWRNRSAEENLDLFERMKAGEFADGEKVLRAKIDMAHPNMLFRDPIMYRIIHARHHRTGDKWCIYPMYDYAHGQSDSIEHITHSICTLEFDVHRPLYDWFIQALGIWPSHQYEFARLNLTYTMMSKRKLLKLVQEGAVMGWDDPRMPTICALRRKGYTPASVRAFAEMVGVAKRDNVIDLGKMEYCVREDLNKVAERRMAVLNPVKVTVTNYPEGKVEYFECVNNPEDPSAGTRQVPFSRELYIERDDFMENPPKKFFRLQPGGEVRLRRGPVALAAQYGGFCILDEINMAKNDAVAVLHSALDYRRLIDVPGYECIPIHPAARFIATMNYGYAGTRELNEALVSRFTVIRMPTLEEPQLCELLRANVPEASDENIKRCTGLFLDLNAKAVNGEISTNSVDMRGMIAALHLMTDGMAPKDAIAVSITNKCFDEYEYALVRDVALTRFA